MDFRKIMWAIRFQFYKVYLKKVGKIGYFGKPISIINPKKIYLGNRVRIYPGARLECHDNGSIVIEDNVSIGQNVHITSGKKELRIRSGTTITGNVCITNMEQNYSDIDKPILEQGFISKKTVIGKNCFIGFNAVIQAGTELKDHCVIGAHAVVRGNYDDYSVIAGIPAKVIKKYNLKTNNWERIKNEYK